MASPEVRVGDGWESQFATNHLGTTCSPTGSGRLWCRWWRAGDRAVLDRAQVSDIRWDDPQFTTGYDKWQAYGQAKTADSLFAVQLDALGEPSACVPSRFTPAAS